MSEEVAATGRADRVEVGIAEYAVANDGTLLRTHGLGSCIAVALHDGTAGVGALGHVMLPASSSDDASPPAKYADTAVRVMVEGMEDRDADPAGMEAKIAGGSQMFGFSGIGEGVGRRNVAAVREELAARDIPLVAEDVGGDHGRTVEFEAGTGRLSIRTADEEVTVL